MKKLVSLVCAAVVLVACGEGVSATGVAETEKQAAGQLKGKKTLVAYYSYSGNTEAVAKQIAQSVGGALFEITTSHQYPESYNQMTAQAKKEIQDGFKPALTHKVDNIAEYEVVFVGSPNWWGTYAPAVSAFLSAYDFKGKTVIPFFTHGGGGMQRCESDMKKQLSGVTMGPGMTFPGRPSGAPAKALATWLAELGF